MQTSSDNAPHVLSFSRTEQLREGRAVIRSEAAALQQLADDLDASFCDAVRMILSARGRVIVTGVGKAGLIGQKIVATMSSTGTPAHFLHPTEAVHGDLGSICPNDIVVALSNSGASSEVLRLLPILRHQKIPVIAITRDRDNPLAATAETVIAIGRHEEAGALQLAPSTTTTAMLAVGDALSLVLSSARGFTQADFGIFHPAGSLGHQLRPVSEVMRCGKDLRVAADTSTVRQIMIELGRPGRRSGAVILVDSSGRISGIFTDSDLARLFEQRQEHRVDERVSGVMTVNPATVPADMLVPDAIRLISRLKISELPVVNAEGVPLGLIDITDVIDCSPAAASHGELTSVLQKSA